MSKLAIVKLNTNLKFNNRDAEKLRGFMGRTFQENILFHNHVDTFTFNYQSSKIYYKVLDGILSIVGIEDGAESLIQTYEKIRDIDINGKNILVDSEITLKNYTLSIDSEKSYKYNFISPWFALNQENYKKYKNDDFDLNAQLRNNIIEFFKLNRIWADKKIEVSGDFKEMLIVQKDTKVLGFVGEFTTNVKLPSYIGLGKRKSIGYGTIKEVF
ncbi:CRISPR-associated endonuclease Cas6 [uncultured Cetobacterium sp.]|uniref:CRISPR-associated endonuclease Cas6 n=1 Tax=uncultured Cetobacterium sp. TaxID=527638 RepID=UPI0025F0BA08|nr:CRISPR-associated endonuclease Cas6 [uncultured Cetobacterium sp.]